jgi:hypothetical protein
VTGGSETALPGGRFWDDNPSLIDLLGFDAVVEPIEEAIGAPHLDPLTIGVQSPWGGGKSTVLNLLDDRLSGDKRYVVIRTEPWQYDDQEDFRQILIAEVLDALGNYFSDNATVKAKVGDLLRRVAWKRIALAVGKGAVTMSWNPDELLEAFTLKERSSPDSMSGFHASFTELLDQLPGIDRVVLLIDDLDRCLPPAVMGTLEAIKLFLSAEKMVFVLAADQDMIRDAVAAHLVGTNRSEAFARRYLEKIVQLPVSLPRLSEADAETYIGLLFAHRQAPDDTAFRAVVDHASSRRRTNLSPPLAGWSDAMWRPSDETLRLASQLAQGLTADTLSSPRQIKRFLNAYGVRGAIASARDVSIPPSILIKMLLLEDQHRAAFERLAAVPVGERQAFVQGWEDWSHGRSDAPPEGIEELTRDWARADPSLAGYDLTSYMRLAATLVNTSLGGSVSDEVLTLVQDLLDESSESVQLAALTRLGELAEADQASALTVLFESARRVEDLNAMLVMAIRWAKETPALADRVAVGIRENMARLTTAVPAELQACGLPVLAALVPEIAQSTSAQGDVIEAARIELGQ